MRFFLLCVAVLLSDFSFSQKAELKDLCSKTEALINTNKSIHIKYILTVQGKGYMNQQEQAEMNIYIKGGMQKLMMGNQQEVIQKGKWLLLVNHSEQTMVLQEDTSSFENISFMKDLDSFIDSASSVKKSIANGIITFVLSYTPDDIYSRVELGFSEKSKQLKTIYAEFSPAYPEPYQFFKADYQLWETNWKPQAGFRNMENFIGKSGNTWKPLPQWKSYRFFQPQKITLK